MATQSEIRLLKIGDSVKVTDDQIRMLYGKEGTIVDILHIDSLIPENTQYKVQFGQDLNIYFFDPLATENSDCTENFKHYQLKKIKEINPITMAERLFGNMCAGVDLVIYKSSLDPKKCPIKDCENRGRILTYTNFYGIATRYLACENHHKRYHSVTTESALLD